MRFGKILAFLAVAAALSAANASSGDDGGRFFLMDQRTQIPVLCCRIPRSWIAGGKCTWTSNPASPVHWYVWTMRPDRKVKIIFSSRDVIASPTPIQHTAMLNDPAVFANRMLPMVRQDHFMPDARPVGARFFRREIDRQLLSTRLRQAQTHGIRLTNLLMVELVIRYEGTRDGEPRIISVSLPMLISESQASAISRSTMIEMTTPMSFSCPPEEEAATRSTVQAIMGGMQQNPHFIRFVDRISQMRVAKWLEAQGEIRRIQLDAARSSSETQDRVRDMWSEYIRGVDSVTNPNTGETMFVDNRYDHVWINGNDEIIYQNSGPGSFDPNQDSSFNRSSWRQLR